MSSSCWIKSTCTDMMNDDRKSDWKPLTKQGYNDDDKENLQRNWKNNERTKSGNETNQSHRPEKSEHRNWSTSSSNLKTQGLILMICCEKQTCAMMMSRKEPITMMKSKLFQGSLTYSRSPKAANLTTNSKAKKAVKTRFMKSRNSVYGSGWMVAINICVVFHQSDLWCCWYIPDYKIPLRVERCWCKLQQR